MNRIILKVNKSLLLACCLLSVTFNLAAAETENSKDIQALRFGLSGAFGPGYGFGSASELAQDILIETGAVDTGIIASELWRTDAYAGLKLPGKQFGFALNLALGSSAFSVVGYDSSGDPVEGNAYSIISLDIAPLYFYEWPMFNGILYAQAGPYAGINIGNGLIETKTAGLSTGYEVEMEKIFPGSFGGIVEAGQLFNVGPGYLNIGIKITYRAEYTQDFFQEDSDLIHIITPYIFAGYFYKVDYNEK